MPTVKVKRKPAKGGGSSAAGSQCGSGSPGKPGFSSKNTCHAQRRPSPAAKPGKPADGTGHNAPAAANAPALPYAKTPAGIRDRIKDLSARLNIARAARERLPMGSQARGMNLDSSVSLLQRLHAARQGLAAQLKDKRAAERPSLAQRTADVRAKLASGVPAGTVPAKPAEHPVDIAASTLHGLAARSRLGNLHPFGFRVAARDALAPLNPEDRAKLTRDLGAGTHHDLEAAADAVKKKLDQIWKRSGKMGEAPPPRWITSEPAESRPSLARQIEDVRTRLS